ncbi:MAG: UbiD family decarboxylase [Candidatus Heimdallarchaeota archaeon]|nr:UbiD family decarboxylase [Candidatus Heimdallarchaeota archaeon]MCK4768749.1 UbiD family decarboxylase [Candidatus Heimdallarchaeota archaeon]
MSLKPYLDSLIKSDSIVEIEEVVNLDKEVTAYLQKHEEKAVFFKNINEVSFPLVGNLLTTRNQLGDIINSSKHHQEFLQALQNPVEPEEVVENTTFQNQKKGNFSELPIPKFFSNDGGKYLTSGIVFAKFPDSNVYNASIHRIMVIDNQRGAIRLVPRDLHHIYVENSKNGEDTPVAIAVGYHPILGLAASSPLPINHSEMSVANTLLKGKLNVAKTPRYNIVIPTDVEFILEGKIIKDKTYEEGPFVDITGTADHIRKQPIVEIEKLYHKDNPIFQTILPSYEEHFILMGFPRETQIYNYVSKVVPKVHDVYLTPGGSGWLHAVVSVTPQKLGDAKNVALAAFAAHPSLKWCTIVNEDIDVHNPRAVEWATMTRAGNKDIIIIDNVRGSSLDPSRNAQDNTTIKVIIDATTKEEKGNKGYERLIPF